MAKPHRDERWFDMSLYLAQVLSVWTALEDARRTADRSGCWWSRPPERKHLPRLLQSLSTFRKQETQQKSSARNSADLETYVLSQLKNYFPCGSPACWQASWVCCFHLFFKYTNPRICTDLRFEVHVTSAKTALRMEVGVHVHSCYFLFTWMRAHAGAVPPSQPQNLPASSISHRS